MAQRTWCWDCMVEVTDADAHDDHEVCEWDDEEPIDVDFLN